MKIIFYTLPASLLVAYSQLIVKWRTNAMGINTNNQSFLGKMVGYFSDPLIFSAYLAALLGSFAWLLVVTKLPLSIGFPVYIGLTFLLVIIGSWLLLGENISQTKILAIFFIFIGVALGSLK
ncbi:MAG: hypothetical protein WAX04_10320 [Oscillospiraceae bacterium]